MTDQPQIPEEQSFPASLSFKEAWRGFPLVFRALIFFCVFFIVLTISHLAVTLFSSPTDDGYKKIRISGETAESGIYDPSVAFSSETVAWLAYSVVKAGKNPANPLAEVHLAISSDAGKNWNYIGTPVFSSRNETLYAPDGTTPLAEGIVRYEGPGLIYDPKDTGREWKIFAYRYFWNGDVDLATKTAVISLKYTSDPMGKWSDEIWLFSARPGIPPAPYDRLVLLALSLLSPELADVTSYSEPAPFVYDGKIYLLLTAFSGNDKPTRLVLIVSNDHGNGWRYVGSPLSYKDAGIKEITQVSGGSLVAAAGKVYLLAGFGTEQIRSLGVDVFEMADISKAALRRDAKSGLPLVIEKIPPARDSPLLALGAGSASADARLVRGIMLSQMTMENGQPHFDIFSTLCKIGQKD